MRKRGMGWARKKREPKPIQPRLPGIDWKPHLPLVCPDCRGMGFMRQKGGGTCQMCHGNCFVPRETDRTFEVYIRRSGTEAWNGPFKHSDYNEALACKSRWEADGKYEARMEEK